MTHTRDFRALRPEAAPLSDWRNVAIVRLSNDLTAALDAVERLATTVAGYRIWFGHIATLHAPRLLQAVREENERLKDENRQLYEALMRTDGHDNE